MSFFNSFFGSDQRKAIKKSSAEAMGYLDTGENAARGDVNAGAAKAYGYLDPYAQAGSGANSLLAAYLGVNGPDAQRQAMTNFQSDPGYQALYQQGINALDRSATARGGLYSGAAMKGLQDYGQGFARSAWNDRINQLQGFAGQGLQAAGAGANIASNTGNTLGNLSFGLGQLKASNAINKGNALAQASNIGINNLMGLGGMLIGGMNAGANVRKAGGMF